MTWHDQPYRKTDDLGEASDPPEAEAVAAIELARRVLEAVRIRVPVEARPSES